MAGAEGESRKKFTKSYGAVSFGSTDISVS